MSFFRHREIFRSDAIRLDEERRNRRSPAHRLDEFPVGYSSASCTPAALASASSTGIHSATQARRRPTYFQPTANSVLTFCVTPGDNRKESLSAERFRTWLLTCFAIAALLLATLGIAGLLAYNAAQRTQEFGLRIALGATRQDLFGLVFRNCLRLSGIGIAIGVAISMAATRTISALLYDTSPIDGKTFLAVPLILVVVALVAAVLPACRVLQTDPMTALRAE
jgi:FtsX-like permease family